MEQDAEESFCCSDDDAFFAAVDLGPSVEEEADVGRPIVYEEGESMRSEGGDGWQVRARNAASGSGSGSSRYPPPQQHQPQNQPPARTSNPIHSSSSTHHQNRSIQNQNQYPAQQANTISSSSHSNSTSNSNVIAAPKKPSSAGGFHFPPGMVRVFPSHPPKVLFLIFV